MEDGSILPYVVSLEGKKCWSFEHHEWTLEELKDFFFKTLLLEILKDLTKILLAFMFSLISLLLLARCISCILMCTRVAHFALLYNAITYQRKRNIIKKSAKAQPRYIGCIQRDIPSQKKKKR